MMILPKDVRSVIKEISKGDDLFEALKRLKMAPLEFIKYLNNHPEDKIEFETARQLATERWVSKFESLIDNANDKFELEKAKLKISTGQWLAEKLVPHTYGTKIDINVNKTIDIRTTLAEAKARVQVESTVSQAISDAVFVPVKDEGLNSDDLEGLSSVDADSANEIEDKPWESLLD